MPTGPTTVFTERNPAGRTPAHFHASSSGDERLSSKLTPRKNAPAVDISDTVSPVLPRFGTATGRLREGGRRGGGGRAGERIEELHASPDPSPKVSGPMRPDRLSAANRRPSYAERMADARVSARCWFT